MRYAIIGILFLVTLACKKNSEIQHKNQTISQFHIPPKSNTWVFLLAGQSNMAGCGIIEPVDTVLNQRIFSISSQGRIVYAREPIHFYDTRNRTMGCGLSFGNRLIESIPDSINILLVPTALAGTSIEMWLEDSLHSGYKLLSNFRKQVNVGKKYGQVKAILWHQGESNTTNSTKYRYRSNLTSLISVFRSIVTDPSLLVLLGELGGFSNDDQNWQLINKQIRQCSMADTNTSVVSTADLPDDGGRVHFSSEGQRKMGKRFADEFLKKRKL